MSNWNKELLEAKFGKLSFTPELYNGEHILFNIEGKDKDIDWAYGFCEWEYVNTTYHLEDGDLHLTCPEITSGIVNIEDSDGEILPIIKPDVKYQMSQEELASYNEQLKEGFFDTAYDAYIKDLEDRY